MKEARDSLWVVNLDHFWTFYGHISLWGCFWTSLSVHFDVVLTNNVAGTYFELE